MKAVKVRHAEVFRAHGLLLFLIFLYCLLTGKVPLFGGDGGLPALPYEMTEESTELSAEAETLKRVDIFRLPSEAETEAETEALTVSESESVPETQPPYVAVESLSLDKYEVVLSIGMTDMPWVSMYPEDATDKRELWYSDNTAVAVVDLYGNITAVSSGSCTVTVESVSNNAARATVSVTVLAPPETEAAIAPAEPTLTYIDGILIANKTYSLPSDYDPGVDAEAYGALTEMFAAAASEGLSMYVCSGYRSYATQAELYNSYVYRDGSAAADRYSARPGHSEHQTGLAFDINSTSSYFAGTPEANWIEANCHRFGYILRYPAGKEWATGYMYEPWHIRYIGKEAAEAVYASGLCLEEYLGITSVYE